MNFFLNYEKSYPLRQCKDDTFPAMANDAFQIEALAVVNSPENNLNFRIKAEPVTTGADATVYCTSGFCFNTYLAKKPDLSHWTCSNRERLGY